MPNTTDVFARCREERGQTMAEYGVVLALVTLAVLGAMTTLSGNISGAFTSIAGILP
jgi:pilus assembly protein Flp/PilA